jgi:hypothetical protein
MVILTKHVRQYCLKLDIHLTADRYKNVSQHRLFLSPQHIHTTTFKMTKDAQDLKKGDEISWKYGQGREYS